MTDFVIINGMDTREIDVFCTSLPPIQIAQERVNKIPVPGRSGYLHVSDDSFEPQIKKCGFFYAGENAAEVARFFMTAQTVIFSNEPDRIYSCSFYGDGGFENLLFDWHEFDIRFECDPEKRESSPTEIIATNGMVLTHPGNWKTRPTFEITGTGTVVLTVGTQTITLTDVAGTVIVDGDLQSSYTSAGVPWGLHTTGDCPLLYPGIETPVSWTGAVTNVSISPNWRWV